MADGAPARGKFVNAEITADGAPRAQVAFERLDTLWVNTGALCNIECAHCYIESSPTNDRLAFLTAAELAPFLGEAEIMGAQEIGFTGGEPFMNPHMPAMAEDALSRGFEILILTNAMRPMMRPRIKAGLAALRDRFGAQIKLRVSLDHFAAARHDEERGPGGYAATLNGLRWLFDNGFCVSIAGRTRWDESEVALRRGFAALFKDEGFALDAHDPENLILFPEMDETAPVPEITEDCWAVLGKKPSDVMCAASRMVVKRKGAPAPAVLSCTLLAYDRAFELGATLAEAARPVRLNHPHCAKFCVLGGASCSG